ncbi:bifunctional diaminohydroxyphosphoribosylaminopyrimidine deaminase/5-amino-6-(5-phosphoribosylamino)uracil reductase RibD [Candidatus Margulisiibacteriota bacterium]
MNEDVKFMKLAIELARSQVGVTSPDPLVGAVLVKNGKIISKGYHAEFSTPHAEDFAIKKAGKKAHGSTLYVNLEPCCHFGNNPPCTQKIINAGVKRIVAAMQDPNPLVSGKGFKELREADIKVDIGILKEEAKELNESFTKHVTTGLPFVILKSAMTLDGKIATSIGDSKWISSKPSRQLAHYLRNNVDAVIVGLGTVKKDDPKLTVRDVGTRKIVKRDPKRIILDSLARTPLNSNVIKTDPENTIIVVTNKAPKRKIEALRQKNVSILKVKAKGGYVDLRNLISELGKRDFTSIMIEGGGSVNASALSSKIVDKIYVIISPKIFGGEKAKTIVEGKGVKRVAGAVKFSRYDVKKIGEDILIEGYIKK